MIDDSTTAVRCAVGVTEGFEVKDLSPCLFGLGEMRGACCE